jgi:hypothetical protein
MLRMLLFSWKNDRSTVPTVIANEVLDVGLFENAIGQVTLVANEQTRTLGAVVEAILVVEVLLPAGARSKRVNIVEIKHDETKVRVLVVDVSHVDVSLLAANVPELQIKISPRRRLAAVALVFGN